MTICADSKIIDELGGTATVARLCKVKAPSVSAWRKTGIPPARRQYLEVIRPDVFINAPGDAAGRVTGYTVGIDVQDRAA